MISIVLSRLALFLVSLSLVRYVFLFLPLCTFTCSGVRVSLVVHVCPFFPTFLVGILLFYHSFTFPYTYSFLRTSSRPSRPFGLLIGGSSTEGSDLGQTGGGSDSCHGRVSGINKICFLFSSYCRSQATAA